MSLLSIIQSHCRLHALAVPTAVIGSTDTTIIQLFEILREVCEELVTESNFNVTTQEALFNTTAVENQGGLGFSAGAFADLAPYGYQWIIGGTMYNRTRRLPVIGPVSESEWQELHALVVAGPLYRFRVLSDFLNFYPVPPAGELIAFEYVSSWYIKNAAGSIKQVPTLDTDNFLFPENILRKGLAFRWKQIKGLPYQVDEVRYNELLNNYIARDKVKAPINVSDPSPRIQPGVFVAPYNTVS